MRMMLGDALLCEVSAVMSFVSVKISVFRLKVLKSQLHVCPV